MDDKVLTSWNGLMLATMAEAARVLESGNLLPNLALQAARFHKMATRNAEFLLSTLRPNGKLRHSWRDGKSTNGVFLEDYAALILGLLDIRQTSMASGSNPPGNLPMK